MNNENSTHCVNCIYFSAGTSDSKHTCSGDRKINSVTGEMEITYHFYWFMRCYNEPCGPSGSLFKQASEEEVNSHLDDIKAGERFDAFISCVGVGSMLAIIILIFILSNCARHA